MKRHTTEPQRYGRHERASIAVRAVRETRKLLKPVRLFLLAIQESNAEAHFANVAANLQAGGQELLTARREMVRLEEKRMAIERGVA